MIDEEVSRSTIAITVRASKLTARGLAYVLGAAARKIRKAQRAGKAPQGKQSARRLMLFKANQADAITGCFSEYSRRMLARTKKGRAPVLEQMEQAQEQVRQQPHRQREREKEVAAEDR